MSSVVPYEIASPVAVGEEEVATELIEDYLDHLCAPLVGLIPYRDRFRLRQEAAYNIEGRMRVYVLDGMSPEAAAREAIAKYGRSDALGEQFLQEWIRYEPHGWLARKLGMPNLYALFFFGQASLWGMVMALYQVFFPSPDPVTFGLTLEQVRRLVPAPLPMPDRNPLFIVFWIYVLLAPIAAGVLTGLRVPVGAAKAVVQAMLLYVLVSFGIGLLLWPASEGIWLALVQLVWWSGVGTGTAHLTSLIVRKRRFRFRFQSPGQGNLDELSQSTRS